MLVFFKMTTLVTVYPASTMEPAQGLDSRRIIPANVFLHILEANVKSVMDGWMDGLDSLPRC